MINIKTNKKFKEYIRKRKILLLSSDFARTIKHEQYKILHQIVTEDEHISMTILLLYLARKGKYVDALLCMKDYNLVQRFKDKQWFTHTAVLRYIKHKEKLNNIQLPVVLKIYAIYLITHMMTKRPDYTSNIAIAKFLRMSSTKTQQIYRILGGKI